MLATRSREGRLTRLTRLQKRAYALALAAYRRDDVVFEHRYARLLAIEEALVDSMIF